MPFDWDPGSMSVAQRARQQNGSGLAGLDMLAGLPPEIAQSAANFLLQRQASDASRTMAMAHPDGAAGQGFAGLRPRGGPPMGGGGGGGGAGGVMATQKRAMPPNFAGPIR